LQPFEDFGAFDRVNSSHTKLTVPFLSFGDSSEQPLSPLLFRRSMGELFKLLLPFAFLEESLFTYIFPFAKSLGGANMMVPFVVLCVSEGCKWDDRTDNVGGKFADVLAPLGVADVSPGSPKLTLSFDLP
jgi:hypothetical protein